MKIKILHILAIIFLLVGCNTPNTSKEEIGNSLYDIKHKKKIRVVMDYNSINYFIYKGKPMGFQYELAQTFAKHIGVSLDVVVNNNLGESFKMLEENKCNILTTSLTNTKERAERFDFSYPIGETAIVLIQRTGKKSNIGNIEELKDKTIYVKSNTVYESTLEEYNTEKDLNINIISVKNFSTEDLIRMVSKKEIDYTVSDENIAYINAQFHNNIDISIRLSEKQNLSWGISKEQKELKQEVDKWLKTFVKSYKYRIIYNKYYNSRRAVNVYKSTYNHLNIGKISEYDDILKQKSKKINWDWKLLASLMFQESRFNPEAESWAGAYGLMQIMPETANMVRVEDYKEPINNIEAGVRYIRYIERLFKKELKDTTDLIPFVLASYNVGPGHVLDARRLARKYGKNPDRWYDNTDFFLLNKANPLYYKDNLARNGYCNGEEPYNYVEDIMERYYHYINLIKE